MTSPKQFARRIIEIEEILSTSRFGGAPNLFDELNKIAPQIAKRYLEAIEILKFCKEKLALYRDQHSGEYIGGMEYQSLRTEIEKFLKEHNGGVK